MSEEKAFNSNYDINKELILSACGRRLKAESH